MLLQLLVTTNTAATSQCRALELRAEISRHRLHQAGRITALTILCYLSDHVWRRLTSKGTGGAELRALACWVEGGLDGGGLDGGGGLPTRPDRATLSFFVRRARRSGGDILGWIFLVWRGIAVTRGTAGSRGPISHAAGEVYLIKLQKTVRISFFSDCIFRIKIVFTKEETYFNSNFGRKVRGPRAPCPPPPRFLRLCVRTWLTFRNRNGLRLALG